MNKEKIILMLITFYVTAHKQQMNYEGDLPKHMDPGDNPYFFPIYNLVEKEIRKICAMPSIEEEMIGEFEFDIFMDKLHDCAYGDCTEQEVLELFLAYNPGGNHIKERVM
ncbi:hypothetical protein [Evansella cellulosilytica]|uniref:Uncharacterized protein n=1 Tax=Evansella cellulosilytica (strain ATCC 21833 / DSM 2522 / FERM P-1141 / JCM 9156 / N-4) TaxID=649639 RepID=E6TVI4_EVAC2|nr:hypothetical protein [Evansella cellulosilytica]ADU31001.1 hypothetical protein Bcell_2746 [Evansella cellulosilytica DSM 2522]